MKYISLILFTFLIGFDGYAQEESRKEIVRSIWKKIRNCHKEKTKETILEIKDFLNSKGYKVETEGELNTSFKKGITEYYKSQGLPHLLPENVFEIDTKKINDKFCECISRVIE